MSNKYIVVDFAEGDGMQIYPTIDQQAGMSWRDAKKALRAYYLQKAQSLRAFTEKEYFNNDQS